MVLILSYVDNLRHHLSAAVAGWITNMARKKGISNGKIQIQGGGTLLDPYEVIDVVETAMQQLGLNSATCN